MALSLTKLKEICSTLRGLGDNKDIKQINGSKVAIITTYRQADKIIPELANALPFYGEKAKIIDDRNLVVDNKTVSVKVRRKKGVAEGKNGLHNEDFLYETIRQAIKDNGGPLTIQFVVNGSVKLEISDVRKVTREGQKGTVRRGEGTGKKADIHIYTPTDYVPVSIKKDNASNLASADTEMAEIAEKFWNWCVKNKKVKLLAHESKSQVFKVHPYPYFELPAKIGEKMAFGTDLISTGGGICVRSFKADDFEFDEQEEILKIRVSHFYKRYHELDTKHKAFLLIRNDSSRKTKALPPGLRYMVVNGGGGELRTPAKKMNYHLPNLS